jgi:putative hemin transport protein
MDVLATNGEATGLRSRWAQLREQHPQIRVRDAASRLGVSEAELIATGCGDSVTRLEADWGELIQSLPELGEVMALTRNEHVVHEKTGQYQNIEIYPDHGMGMVVGEAIDLRLFLGHWHYGFAVSESTRIGLRRSLQFFDSDGTAVHKIYLKNRSDAVAYEYLIGRYHSTDQTPLQRVKPLPAVAPPSADEDIDVTQFRSAWQAMQNTHDFFPLLKRFGLQRLQALRLAEPGMVYKVANHAHRALLEAARDRNLPIMVFAGSRGVLQIHSGPVNKLVVADDWYNVMDPGFNLHLREPAIASSWVVRKPTENGVVTSLELYDTDANQIVQFFGKRESGQHESATWRQLVQVLPEQES